MDKQLIDKHLRKISYVTLAIFITIFAFESISLSSNFQGIPPSPRKKNASQTTHLSRTLTSAKESEKTRFPILVAGCGIDRGAATILTRTHFLRNRTHLHPTFDSLGQSVTHRPSKGRDVCKRCS